MEAHPAPSRLDRAGRMEDRRRRTQLPVPEAAHAHSGLFRLDSRVALTREPEPDRRRICEAPSEAGAGVCAARNMAKGRPWRIASRGEAARPLPPAARPAVEASITGPHEATRDARLYRRGGLEASGQLSFAGAGVGFSRSSPPPTPIASG
jgi:hypothetical protein